MPFRSGLGGGSRRGGAGGACPLAALSAASDALRSLLDFSGAGGRRASTSSPSLATAARNACGT